MILDRVERRRVSKEEYRTLVPDLRVRLLNAQFDLRRADFPVLVLVCGSDHTASNETIDLLHEWLDARYLETQVFLDPTDEERQRPASWR